MAFNTLRANRIKYTLWAPVYDRIANILAGMRKRSLELAHIGSGERVLVLGAGTGLDLEYLPKDAHITAIDWTPAMLDRLRARALRLNINVDARVMNGQALEFANDSFDVVILHLIVSVIPDPTACLRETARVLRSGGRAIILDKFVPDHGTPTLLQKSLNPLMNFFGTDITRKLGPLLAEASLQNEYEEPGAFGGFYKIVIARKR